jgi:peptidoglycan/xylan/chitin deacetylase (PgdA/CDA1 family)
MSFSARVMGRFQRTMASSFCRRLVTLNNNRPLISFTFDDFPRSALHTGGEILIRAKVRGTYYASFGLMGTAAPTGEIFTQNDLAEFKAQGHELGCHTFAHCHAWNTNPRVFEQSVIENRAALERLWPGQEFWAFSYPILVPRPATKQRTGRFFRSCRAGGQTYNTGTVDLNLMKAFFIEKTCGELAPIQDLIRQNAAMGGWLIFATHDVCESPTAYGCRPSFLRDIVQCAVDSGAVILPVTDALDLAQPTS